MATEDTGARDAGGPVPAEPGAETSVSPAPPVDRSAAFRAGPPPFPKKALAAIVATVVVVAVFVAIVDRLAASGTAAPSLTPRSATHGVVGGAAAPPSSAKLHAPLSALLGLITLHGQKATAWSLTDAATGQPVSLASLRGHVVVLTFADADCKDICPVLAAELAKARSLLGATRVPVTFVTVNSDPLDLGPRPPALRAPGFAGLTGWRFLTGPLATLNKVWTDYGISIRVNTGNHRVSHNDLMYFIGPTGTLAWTATPFADEQADGAFTLTAAVTARFAQGIAHYAGELASRS